MLKKNLLSLKQRWVSCGIAYSIKFLTRIILKTCHIRIQGLETFVDTVKNTSCILMLWHSHLVILPEILYSYAGKFKYTAFISKSQDANPLAILAASYECGQVIRVPHNAKHFALSRLIGVLQSKTGGVIITPDGPRGPRYKIKPGIILAARETGADIFPFSWKADRYWQLGTWDQMRIPKPFSKIEAVFGPPLNLNKEYPEGNQEDASLLKNALDSL